MDSSLTQALLNSEEEEEQEEDSEEEEEQEESVQKGPVRVDKHTSKDTRVKKTCFSR